MNLRGTVVLVAVVLAVTGLVVWKARGEEDAKRHYIAGVDAVCAWAEQQADPDRYPVDTPEQQVAELRRASVLMTATLRRIETIPAPGQDAARVESGFLRPMRTVATGLGRLSSRAERALAGRDLPEVDRLVTESLRPDPQERAARLFATEYGFAACAGQAASQAGES